MLKKIVSVLVAGSALTFGTFGVMSLAVSSAPASADTSTGTHCTNAQKRVNAVAAKLKAAQNRLSALQTKLATATAKNKTARVKKIQARIDKLNAKITKLNARLQKIEQACQVQPGT